MSEHVNDQALEVQHKQALDSSQEQTIEGNFYRPPTDIFETADALTVVMEVPGVDREHVDVRLDKDELTVAARIGLERYSELQPVYTEYDIGHFTRSFHLSSVVDREGIEASVADGVLTLRLPKIKEAAPRRIRVN
jgi:HSP20 family molecular chaperone IbpA